MLDPRLSRWKARQPVGPPSPISKLSIFHFHETNVCTRKWNYSMFAQGRSWKLCICQCRVIRIFLSPAPMSSSDCLWKLDKTRWLSPWTFIVNHRFVHLKATTKPRALPSIFKTQLMPMSLDVAGERSNSVNNEYVGFESKEDPSSQWVRKCSHAVDLNAGLIY